MSTNISMELFPFSSFTPQDPMVEALKVAMEKDVIFVMLSPTEKSFIVLKLLSEKIAEIKANKGQAIFLVAKEEQAVLWSEFLNQMLNFPISHIAEDQNHDQIESREVLVATVNAYHHHMKQSSAKKVSLCIIDNGHLLKGNSQFQDILEQLQLACTDFVARTTIDRAITRGPP